MQRPLSITIIGIIGVIWGLAGTIAGLGGMLIILTAPEWFMDWVKRAASPELATLFSGW